MLIEAYVTQVTWINVDGFLDGEHVEYGHGEEKITDEISYEFLA